MSTELTELKRPQAAWHTLREAIGRKPRIEALFAPISKSLRRRAQLAARKAFPDLPDDLTQADVADLHDFSDRVSLETAKAAILAGGAWRGVGDAKRKPAPVTAENVDMLLAHEDIMEAADRLYCAPAAARAAEKNGSAASSNGNSKGAAGTARAADRRTAKPASGSARASSTPSRPAKPRKS